MGKGGGQRGRVRSIFSVIIAFLEVLMGIIIPALTALYMLQPRGGSLTETEMHVVCALDGYDPLRPSICNLAYSAIVRDRTKTLDFFNFEGGGGICALLRPA